MYIQIDGIYYPNKGDELMFFAILDKLKSQKELNVIPVFGKGKGGANPMALRVNGVFQLAKFRRYKIRFEWFLTQRMLNSYGLIKEGQAKIVLDSGGFQFGDQWNNMYSSKLIKELERYYKALKKNKVKLIFLPQALGPFKTKKAQKVIKIIYKYSELIYARDQQSFNYLKELFGTSHKIKKAPDFTISYAPKENINLIEKVDNPVIIIPNSKMISHTNKNISNSYIDFISKLSLRLTQKGENVIFLNHEAIGDKKLIENVIEKTKIEAIVLNDLSANNIKVVIGKAKLVISSRYHGLISALNQNIPTFCTSWSHKYQELMNEFGLNDNILNLNNIETDIEKVVAFIDNSNKYPYAEHEKAISDKADMTEQMWEDIFKIIRESK